MFMYPCIFFCKISGPAGSMDRASAFGKTFLSVRVAEGSGFESQVGRFAKTSSREEYLTKNNFM